MTGAAIGPVAVHVLRGGIVESAHAGALCIVDDQDRVRLAMGDVSRGVFPRSAIKALQALPLIETGAADRFGLSDAELALACASHSGEPAHVDTAASMLAKAGRDAGCLECGTHWPMGDRAARDLAAAGRHPSALHNNCSGKHAGFVCVACAMDEEPKGYVGSGHRVQREVAGAIEQMTGHALEGVTPGVDGCSIPTWPIPLRALARGFARFGTGAGLAPERAAATVRLRAAVAAHPFMVAGTGHFDTTVMQALGARVFLKTGAEGVYCAAIPERGWGIALKCADGSSRAAQTMMASVILAALNLSEVEHAAVFAHAPKILTNWNGMAVGEIKPAPDLTYALTPLRG